MKRQLDLQAKGLSGNLDKIWPDIRDSAWIGGECEGWERVPYWLDGFIPLAYLLDDGDMKVRAKKYIDAILSRQKENGWICPCKEEDIPKYDTWAVLLISKVFTVYYDCTHDERIPFALYKMMLNYYERLKKGTCKLFEWGKYRWYEGFIALNFLSERYDEKWIRELAEILDAQGHDYADSQALWERPLNKWTFETHVVNLAMMLKTEAVTGKLLNDKYMGQAEMLWNKLIKYNGTVTGIFTGDECLSGLSPIQGTELCGVAELMYSFELLFCENGDGIWADRLEKLAFNALPATLGDDMWTHQYDQSVNQIACRKFPGRSLFRTNGAEAHLFGLEPNYGCCTANFNQAFPKLMLSSFAHDGDKVISVIPLPSTLETEECSVKLETDYPFMLKLRYAVEAKKEFCFAVRVPSFVEQITVDGNAENKASELCFDIAAGEKREIVIEYTASPHFEKRPNGMKSIVYGSLVFSLPIKYTKEMHEYEDKGVERKFPYCDYELVPCSEWRYAFANDKLYVNDKTVGDIPFSSENPPMTVTAEVARINWEYEDGFDTVAAKLPSDRRAIGATEQIEFYPYGCAKLRVTELPETEKGDI